MMIGSYMISSDLVLNWIFLSTVGLLMGFISIRNVRNLSESRLLIGYRNGYVILY